MKTPEPVVHKATPVKAVNRLKSEDAKTKTDASIQPNKDAAGDTRLREIEVLAEAQEELSSNQADREYEQLAKAEVSQHLPTDQEVQDAAEEGKATEQETRIIAEREELELEKALAISSKDNNRKTHLKSSSSDLKEGEQRVSFVLRITLDEHGRPLRSEIEDAQSGKKRGFPDLNIQDLIDYIESCVPPRKPTVPPSIPDQTGLPPKKTKTSSEILSQFSIIELETFCINCQGNHSVIFQVNEPFSIKTRFNIQAMNTLPQTYRNIQYEITVLAHGIDSKINAILATFSSNLVFGINEHASQMKEASLPNGIFRLITILKFVSPINICRFSEGPFIRIDGTQAPAEE